MRTRRILWGPPKSKYKDRASEKRFSELLEQLQCGTMRYRVANDLQFGKKWNKSVNYKEGWSAVIWACHKVKGLKIARSYEVPFANANGAAWAHLRRIRSSTPTPKGDVKLDLSFDGGTVAGTVTLPDGLSGVFRWNGADLPLSPGSSSVVP